MSDKLIAIVLLVVSWGAVETILWNGYGNVIAGWVLTFACGMLAGSLAKRRRKR